MFILMIDDEPSSAKPVADLLEYLEIKHGWQYHCSLLPNLVEIKQDIEKHVKPSPDVILLDIAIRKEPNGDVSDEAGLTLLEEIEAGKLPQINNDVKVIVMSGHINIDDIKQSHGSLINHWLPKPSDLAELEDILKDYAEG